MADASDAGGSDLETGLRALAAGDLAGAVVALEAAATAGSRQAHMSLVGIFMRGGTMPRDAPRAYRHLCSAAIEPWPPADLMLAACDRSGAGVTPDPARAWQRLRRALDQGHPAAWRAYGMLRALAGDVTSARAALRWALSLGDGYAAHVLGLLALEVGANAEAAAWFEHNPKLGVSRRRRAQLPERAAALSLEPPADAPLLPDAEPWPLQRPAPVGARLHDSEVQVLLAKGTLTRIECDHLVAIAEPSLVRSMVIDPRTGITSVDPIRTSREMAFADAFPDLIVHEAELRLAAVAAHPLDLTEPMVSLHYAPGGQYLPHHDFYSEEAMAMPGHHLTGQRVATVIVYLNRVQRGGGTAFPRLGVEVAPEEGAALTFRNVGATGAMLEDSLHAGLPVLAGEKWIATLWCSTRAVRHNVVGTADRDAPPPAERAPK